jgi:hypothetical protein
MEADSSTQVRVFKTEKEDNRPFRTPSRYLISLFSIAYADSFHSGSALKAENEDDRPFRPTRMILNQFVFNSLR